MEKYGFVYIWFDKGRNRFYIGSHWGTEDDKYICSSDSMRDAHRRRPEDFKRRIVAKVLTNRKDTFIEEQRYLDMIKPEELQKRYYNINLNAKEHWSANEHTRKLVIEKITLLHANPEFKKKHSAGCTGRVVSDETKEKLREVRKNQIAPNIGRKFGPHSEEHKKRISDTMKNKGYGFQKGSWRKNKNSPTFYINSR